MKSTISWQLYSENSLIIDLNDVSAFYEKDEKLEFYEENVKNIINLKEKKYTRITNEYEMNIDFDKKLCYFKIPNEEKLVVDIEGNISIIDTKIIMEYNYGEAKKIVINVKE